MSGTLPIQPELPLNGIDAFAARPPVAAMFEEEGLAPVATVPVDDTPVYKKYAESRIPVSKVMGKLWMGRINSGKTARKPHENRWLEAVRYYNLDQVDHREDRGNQSGNKRFARKHNEQWSESENVIFSAIKAVVPGIYARNPVAEFTAAADDSDEQKNWATVLEKVCNKLSSMRAPPGLNLKYKVKQAIVAAKLTNCAWMEIGYTQREQSTAQAQEDLAKLSKELEGAKEQKDIRRIEGALMALEEKISFLNPPGPFVRYWSPTDVLVDPEACEPDFADARWMAVEELISTDYLNAVYGEKDDNGKVKSIYKPDVVLLGTTSHADETQNEINSFKLFDTSAEHTQYGYRDKEAYKAAQRTKCWRIYDKVTRRVYLYADQKWDWPIWVEDDILQLPSFFPFEPLLFNVAPMGAYAASEVSYVLDQQDAINEINDTERRARMDVAYKVLFNKKAGSKTSIERILKGAGPVAEPISVPDGMKIDDLFFTPVPSAIKAPQLFDKDRKRQVIDSILGVTPSLRAAEYKTNTTNKAIEQYNSNTATRLDEQIDEIEEFLGRIYYAVAFLCARFMSQEEVGRILGAESAQNWQRIDDPHELRALFNMRIVGGSTTKPNSEAKRQQAAMVGQVLGQFANAAPITVVTVMLRLFEEAFDEIGITEEQWRQLEQEVTHKQQVEAQAAQPQPGGPPAGEQPQQSGGPNVEHIAQLIDTLPPPAKAALGAAMAKGVPIAEALPQVMQLLNAAPPPSQPPS